MKVAVILPSRGLTSTPDGKKAYMKEYRQRKKAEIKEWRRSYFISHQEQENATRRKLRETNPVYAQNDRERCRLRRLSHKDERRAYDKKRYSDKYRTDPQYRLRIVLRARLRGALKELQKSGSAVVDLGCSIPELKMYLESQFEKGMSWDNWGLFGWHIDHKTPLAAFDLTRREQFLKANHYTNLQPLWGVENWKKGAR